MRLSLLLSSGILLSSACAPTDATPIASVGQHIVNGTPSTAEQDAVVAISHDDFFVCSGTLIRSNLVLTARHCVSQLDEESGECGTAKSTYVADAFTVALGVQARQSGASVARGVRVFVPPSSSLCGADIALIQLDQELTNAKTAAVRYATLVVDEPMTAVGYGVDGTETFTPGRYQRTDLKIAAVGPASGSYETKSGISLTFALPAGDVVTGESTCIGDSGGPLFDAEGNVAGITSRGIDFECFDRPTIFTGLPQHEQLISDALAAAALGRPPLPDAGTKPLEPPAPDVVPQAPAPAPPPRELRAHGASCTASSGTIPPALPLAIALLFILRRRRDRG